MKCKETMQRYLELDNQETLPLAMRLHVFFCHACREEIERLAGLFERMRDFTDGYPSPDFSQRILSLIGAVELEPEVKKTTPLRYWLGVGVLFVVGTIVVQFIKPTVQVKLLSGGVIELPLNIICCAGVMIYLAVFIGSHIEEVSKFLKIRRSH